MACCGASGIGDGGDDKCDGPTDDGHDPPMSNSRQVDPASVTSECIKRKDPTANRIRNSVGPNFQNEMRNIPTACVASAI
jgi:hypothetical protein